jgi:hypothetical protein
LTPQYFLTLSKKMRNNPKFDKFLTEYFSVQNTPKAEILLKNFMLSLTPSELTYFVVETSTIHNNYVAQRLASDNCTEEEKEMYEEQFETLLSAFANRKSHSAKAA